MAPGSPRARQDQDQTVIDLLIYTDAAAAESINGEAGFQFIARSSGATATDEEVVSSRLLHKIPDDMGREAWQTHPPTCTYVVEGSRMYLGRGASTGAALDGRPGNQLTQAIMTSDPYDLLPLRPAQIYSAPEWLCERPGVRQLEAWALPLEINSTFDVAALHELAVTDEWARTALPALLTMLEQTQGDPRVRLIIRHPKQSHVMRWIALLSHFLDAEAALRLEFRVFSETPLSTSDHIVGAHPDLSPDLTVDRASADVNLVDLEDRSHTAIEPSESAQRHARWFLTGEPYEALDAVEVSRRWARVMAPDIAAGAAELACLASERTSASSSDLSVAAAALRALADGSRSDELEAYGGMLIDVIQQYLPGESDDLLPVVGTLWALSEAGQTELAQTVALFALEWAGIHAGAAASWAHSPSIFGRGLTWPDAGRRAHGASLLALILACAHESHLPALFALASSLDTGVAAVDVAGAMERLAQVWAADPSLTSGASNWLHTDIVLESLRHRLAALFIHGDAVAIASLRDGAWDWLMPQPWQFDPDEPLSVWLAVRALSGATAATRQQVLATVLPHTNNGAWKLYLATNAGLDPTEVSAWVLAHRAVPPTLVDSILGIVGNIAQHPAWQRGGAARVLHALGSAEVTGLSPALLELVAEQQRILSLFEQAKSVRATVPNGALRALADSDPDSLAHIYNEWVVEAVMFSADLDSALALARGSLGSSPNRFVMVLQEQLRAGEDAALVTALRLLDAERREWNSIGKRALDAVWSDRTVADVRQQLVERLAASPEISLRQALMEYEEKRRQGLLGRVFNRMRLPSIFKSKRD